MILLDTSFLVSYYNTRDENHDLALKLMKRILDFEYGEIYISDYIFGECATVLFRKLKNLQETTKICEDIKTIKMINVDDTIFEATWEIFINQKNTLLSFIDSSIIAVAQNNNIENIATFDEDFKNINKIKVVN